MLCSRLASFRFRSRGTGPSLRWLTLTYDLLLIAFAIFDAWNSKLSDRVRIERHFGSRFAVGAETEVRVEISNRAPRDLTLVVKDEYPPQMKLSGSREAGWMSRPKPAPRWLTG